MEKTQALLEFVARCGVSEGNQASTMAKKLAAVLLFHSTDVQMELSTSSTLIEHALKGVARSHVAVGTPKRNGRPISWDTLLGRQCSVPSWGLGGRVLWLCLASGHLVVARSDEIFASASGVVHPVHCLTSGGVALYVGGAEVGFVVVAPGHQHRGWLFEAIKGEQAQQGGGYCAHTRRCQAGTFRGRSRRRSRRS